MMWPGRTALLKTADATVGSVLCRLLGALSYRFGGDHSVRRLEPERIRRVLVIRPGGMGDMIVLLPMLQALRQFLPAREIDLVCERRNIEALSLAGLRENAWPYDTRPLRVLRRLAGRRYDVAIDTEQFHHFSAILAWLSRAPVRIGFKINPRRNPLYTHLINYAPDGPEGSQFMRLLEPLGLRPAESRLPGALAGAALPAHPPLSDQVEGILRAGPAAVIHAGASTRYKRWPTDRFVELAERLHRDLGLSSILVGDGKDRPLAENIRARLSASGVPAVCAAGAMSLTSTAALLQRARLFVGSDSGLAHLAVAMDRPAVVLFGPSDPMKWGWQDSRRAVVQGCPPCAPCFIFGYHKPCRTIRCMEQIGVDEVLSACRRVLDTV